MSSRTTKKKVLALFQGQDLDQILTELDRMPAKDAVNALFSLICRDELSLRWRAITCMGAQVARLAEENIEEARIMMRRFLWSLNDESGGIGWGAPESMAEVMCNHPALAEEYVHMLISYMREDGDEPHQDGNYIEHPLLQRGLLWAVARLAEYKPELLLTRGADTDVLPYLESSDAEVRGLAALACGRLKIAEAKDGLHLLCQETTTIPLYHEGTLTQVSLNELAQEALEAIG
nr:DVU0298 family protein [uncultured Desulfobulbus sp.]